jgi:hypothetical protein
MAKQQTNRKVYRNLRRFKMVNHDRLWTHLERQRNYQFGMTYCARYGYEKFKRMGKNY